MMLIRLVSIPIQLRSYFTGSTENLIAFPVRAIEVPMFAALSYTAARLKFDRPDAGGSRHSVSVMRRDSRREKR